MPRETHLLKYGADGTLQWRLMENVYRGAQVRLAATTGGGALLAGPLQSGGLQLTAYSGAGALLWRAGFDGAGIEMLTDLAVSPTGEVALAARVGKGSPSERLLVLRYAADGTSLSASYREMDGAVSPERAASLPPLHTEAVLA